MATEPLYQSGLDRLEVRVIENPLRIKYYIGDKLFEVDQSDIDFFASRVVCAGLRRPILSDGKNLVLVTRPSLGMVTSKAVKKKHKDMKATQEEIFVPMAKHPRAQSFMYSSQCAASVLATVVSNFGWTTPITLSAFVKITKILAKLYRGDGRMYVQHTVVGLSTLVHEEYVRVANDVIYPGLQLVDDLLDAFEAGEGTTSYIVIPLNSIK